MPHPEKSRVVDSLRAALREQFQALSTMTAAARDEATSAEAAPENEYDTRALEASYLAAGQGQRLADLRELVDWADHLDASAHAAVGLGSLAHVDDDGTVRWLFLTPQGGRELLVDGVNVQVVGASSPLGAALLHLEAGDEAELETPSGDRVIEVIEVF